MFRPIPLPAVVAMLLGSLACSSEPSMPTAPEPSAPSVPNPSVPSTNHAPFRVEIALEPGLSFPNTERRLRISLVPSTAALAGRHVVLESTNPSVASPALWNDPSHGSVALRSAGTAELRARVDGVVSNAVVLTVAPLPSTTTALVVEEFVLHPYRYDSDPPGTYWYMPQVRLREPTGRATATVVGVMASMPTAPTLGMCTVNRTWAPGESADAFGLDYYFHEPEFSFGPYATVPSSSPVTLTLLIRDQQGVVGTLFLSKTMGPQDVKDAPLAVVTSHLRC